MAVKLVHLQLHWGLAGAREKFEDMTSQLIHVERPDSQRVRVVRGDAGLDSFDGALSDPNGIDVFQVKYFPDGIEKSQKNQIRESFNTARDSKKFKVKSWTLCLPIDMSTDETEWFEGWATSQSGTGITINKSWVRCISKDCCFWRKTKEFTMRSSGKKTRSCFALRQVSWRRFSTN